MLGDRLRELREFKRVTQNEVADELKISREAYSKYETNKRQMNHESLCIVADYFNVTIDYLLGRGERGLFLLNEMEKSMVEKYRQIDERGRKNIDGLLKIEYDRVLPKK